MKGYINRSIAALGQISDLECHATSSNNLFITVNIGGLLSGPVTGYMSGRHGAIHFHCAFGSVFIGSNWKSQSYDFFFFL